jgi:hypothetical protein
MPSISCKVVVQESSISCKVVVQESVLFMFCGSYEYCSNASKYVDAAHSMLERPQNGVCRR